MPGRVLTAGRKTETHARASSQRNGGKILYLHGLRGHVQLQAEALEPRADARRAPVRVSVLHEKISHQRPRPEAHEVAPGGALFEVSSGDRLIMSDLFFREH